MKPSPGHANPDKPPSATLGGKETNMARTPTTLIPLGYKAPDFSLLDVVSAQHRSLAELKGEKATVVMFACNHCPFVKHVWGAVLSLARDYLPRAVGFVVINSNDFEAYPEDAPDKMKALALEKHFPFPYLLDATQEVAKAYVAACTPDFSVFDAELRCVYRGQLDGARPGNDIPPSGEDLRQVLDLLLKGEVVPREQKPSIGCNIKWKF
ncbi:MAG: thioredoxin family protein [Cystobacterineae bacterium]|nr:thioredoxin family protein [Cystobacterineae bacterium]MCL2258468.1 thioredoxin family protein [Cystobacterineae bacterium]